jgi:hydroxyacylglutathione hydrolase
LESLDKVPRQGNVIIHCQGGDRASIAYSLLVKEGYTNISNYSPGMNEWVAKGQEVVTGVFA